MADLLCADSWKDGRTEGRKDGRERMRRSAEVQGIGSLESLLFVGCGSAEGLHQLQYVYMICTYIFTCMYM